jgi:hypothetical protein
MTSLYWNEYIYSFIAARDTEKLKDLGGRMAGLPAGGARGQACWARVATAAAAAPQTRSVSRWRLGSARGCEASAPPGSRSAPPAAAAAAALIGRSTALHGWKSWESPTSPPSVPWALMPWYWDWSGRVPSQGALFCIRQFGDCLLLQLGSSSFLFLSSVGRRKGSYSLGRRTFFTLLL